jgi:hypothetical protein
MPLLSTTREGDAALDAVDVAMPQLWAMSVAFEAHGEIVPKARDDEEFLGHALVRFVGMRRLAVGQHGAKAAVSSADRGAAAIDEVVEAGLDGGDRGSDGLQLGQEALATEGGQGVGTRQNQHGLEWLMQRGCGWKIARYYTVLQNFLCAIMAFHVPIQRQLVAMEATRPNGYVPV